MSASPQHPAGSEHRHSIAVAARRTGLSQFLLRAWEKRYGAVQPGRTPTGRRLYSDHDLDRLLLLRQLTELDHRIGDVAGLPTEELTELARLAGYAQDEPASPTAESRALLDRALEAIARLDARELEQVLIAGAVQMSRPDLRELLLQPLLAEIGKQWQDGTLRIANEHLASAVIRSFILSINTAYQVPAGAPLATVATPAGQLHELGALLAASQALEGGWNVLYLGPNLPAEEIVAATQARQSRAVLLSLVYPKGDPGTAAELRRLRRMLGPDVPLVVGGQAAESYTEAIKVAGALVAPDFAALGRILAEIRH